ncbi:Cytochrome P450 [Amanita muscaria]
MLFSNSVLLDSLVLFALSLPLAKLVLDRRSSHFSVLSGPRSNNLLFGKLREVLGVVDNFAAVFDRWISEYGYVFKVPTGLGTNRIVISDPKAVAHVYANDGFGYLRQNMPKTLSRALYDKSGHSMVSADKEDHRRQRRALVPAFTNAALRESMSVFYDSAYKLKGAWDVLFESHDEVTIDVQQWLDSIGIAGFGHDFRSLDGHKSPVSEALDAFLGDNSFRALLIFAFFIPQLLNLPLKQMKIFRRMKKASSDIAKVLLENSRREKVYSDAEKDRSILGLLLKGRSPDTNFKLLQDEVVGQRLFLFAGYETTAMSNMTITWALVELARHPEKQNKLRQELRQFSGNDPTWDQVVTGTACPYLDAVAHESLRLHPPVEALHRIADKDDVVPLGYPMKTPSGEMIDSIFIPKGTLVTTPFVNMNRNEAFWGPDAKQFVPERWLDENPYPSKEFSGYKHLYTFSDGPRICIGRMFSVAEFKAVLSVLIRNYTFELPSGPDTPIGIHKVILPRPKIADEAGCVLRMRVRQVTG